MNTAILYYKALHLIFIVTWFAGLFYIVRLFIYQTESNEKSEEERKILVPQFKKMSTRLWYGITFPSMFLVVLFGILLIVEKPSILKEIAFHWKFAFVGCLIAYHLYTHNIYKQLQDDVYKWSSIRLRLWNELATLFLFAIIFTVVVFRYTMNVTTGVIGLFVIIGLLVGGVMLYKKIREKKRSEEEETVQDQIEE